MFYSDSGNRYLDYGTWYSESQVFKRSRYSDKGTNYIQHWVLHCRKVNVHYMNKSLKIKALVLLQAYRVKKLSVVCKNTCILYYPIYRWFSFVNQLGSGNLNSSHKTILSIFRRDSYCFTMCWGSMHDS